MYDQLKTQDISVQDLRFDRENPRLAEFGIANNTPENEIQRLLWEVMDVEELVQSIHASGYFPHEPIIVEKHKKGYTVLEGNRRLAAVRCLLNPDSMDRPGAEKYKLTKESRAKLEKLPAILSTRKDSWRYLGFKHVNGPAKWSSLAKAQYIAKVHNDQGIPLADIAQQIGDRHRTAQRLYRGLMALEQAERNKVYDREDRTKARLAFSHLYTGLDYDKVSAFLDLKPRDDESKDPVPQGKIKELGEFLTWLYGSKKADVGPVVERQNPHLRQLDAVLGDKISTSVLRSKNDLEAAYEKSLPPTNVFEKALADAQLALERARSIATAGYDGSERLYEQARNIADTAEDLCAEMERKRGKRRRRRE